MYSRIGSNQIKFNMLAQMENRACSKSKFFLFPHKLNAYILLFYFISIIKYFGHTLF